MAMPAVIRTPGVLMVVKAAPEQRWVMSYEDTLVQVRENLRDIYGVPVLGQFENELAESMAWVQHKCQKSLMELLRASPEPLRNTPKTRNDMADAVAYALNASRLPKTFVMGKPDVDEAIADRMRARFGMPSHSVRDGLIYASVSYGDELNSINLCDPRNFEIGDGYVAIVGHDVDRGT